MLLINLPRWFRVWGMSVELFELGIFRNFALGKL